MELPMKSFLLDATEQSIEWLKRENISIELLSDETVIIDDDSFIMTRPNGVKMSRRGMPCARVGGALAALGAGWRCGHFASPELNEYGEGICPICGELEYWYTPEELSWEEVEE